MPYGDDLVRATLPVSRILGTLDVTDTAGLEDRDHAIREAIENPVGFGKNIFQIVNPGETIAIIVPDSFRTTRVDQILPVLVEGLIESGISEREIFFVYATGTHRNPTPKEEQKILGDRIYKRFRNQTFVHDASDKNNLVYI